MNSTTAQNNTIPINWIKKGSSVRSTFLNAKKTAQDSMWIKTKSNDIA